MNSNASSHLAGIQYTSTRILQMKKKLPVNLVKKPAFCTALTFLCLTGCAGNVSEPTTVLADFSNIHVVLQGTLIAKDSLSTPVRVIGDLAGTAILGSATSGLPRLPGFIVGNTAGTAINRMLSSQGEELEITMASVLENEILRLLSCQIRETGFTISSTTNLPSGAEHLFLDELEQVDDAGSFFTYLEEYLQMNDTWQIDTEADSLLLVHYYLVFADESVGEYLDELSGELAFVTWGLAPANSSVDWIYGDSRQLERTPYQGLYLSEILRSLILTESWPVLSYQPDSACSAKSFIDSEVARKLSQSSNLSDLENFMNEHGIEYTRDRVERRLSGTYSPEENRNMVNEAVNIYLYYKGNGERSFERAVVREVEI